MKTYISILRGINISGQKLIKMDTLKKSYESQWEKGDVWVNSHNLDQYWNIGSQFQL